MAGTAGHFIILVMKQLNDHAIMSEGMGIKLKG